MATITYVNANLPIAGLNFNPPLNEVFDSTPTNGALNPNLYELITNDGPFKDFKVQFHSNVGGTGNFAYAFVNGGWKPNDGTITGITVRAPDGSILIEVSPGATGFWSAWLDDFYDRLTNPNVPSGSAIFNALHYLLNRSNAVQGSAANDHLTASGADGTEVFGNGGNDVLWSPGFGARTLVGGAGDDVIRVENGTYMIRGANPDGSGGAGETDTLEIVAAREGGSTAIITKFSSIDVLRFVAVGEPPPGSDGVAMTAFFQLSEIGEANLSSPLIVHGSSAASPTSENVIFITTGSKPSAADGVTLDLSGWRFKTWNEDQNGIEIHTNSAPKAFNDVVIGTMVADEIHAHSGDDTIRGGGGADELHGGDGNDTFVYGLNEAAPGETINGGENDVAGGRADTVLVQANNDFGGVTFESIERLKFGGKATAAFDGNVLGNARALIIGDGNANTIAIQVKASADKAPAIDLSALNFQTWTDGVDKVIVRGTGANDIITGSSRGDVLAGGGGRDLLEGGDGADAFHFDAGFGKANADRIVDFNRKQGDMIWLDQSTFKKIKSTLLKDSGVLKKSAFEIGRKADDKKDRILYDKKTGTLRFDDDGSGKHKAHVIAVLDDSPALKAGDIFVI